MNLKDIQDILKQFDDSSLTEFELKKADFELYLNKNNQSRKNQTTENIATQTKTQKTSNVIKDDSVPQKGEVITSPIVGVVYLQSDPDAHPYVAIGDSVAANQTVCIVEAMKMMNEIPAGKDGVITEIFIKNEQVVGIGEPLFRIKYTDS
ncbi:MAG: acetyl-CoA carboxylase biotin carboxyl carrier protein [Streptococcaceae bacterium]|nr:acetyl-CoA carboxylase biotin carboxyl carrier protein [Streptococcaceae bacterium]